MADYGFLPYIPDQGDSEVLDIVLEDVNYLLSSSSQQLCHHLRSNSLTTCLSTYLKYAKRPYDPGFSHQPPHELQLWTSMLHLFHRLFTDTAIPSNTKKQLLSPLLDLPHLLDMCGLYGATTTAVSSSSSSPTSYLSATIHSFFTLKPTILHHDLRVATSVIAENIDQQVQAAALSCSSSSSSSSSSSPSSVIDTLSYLKDTFLTLSSLITAYPRCGGIMVQSGVDMFEALGTVHDDMIPKLRSAVVMEKKKKKKKSSDIGNEVEGTEALLAQVQLTSERFALLLLQVGVLGNTGDRDDGVMMIKEEGTNGGGCGGGGGAAGPSGASQQQHHKRGESSHDKGELLLHALMQLAHATSPIIDEDIHLATSADGDTTTATMMMTMVASLATIHDLVPSIQTAVVSKIVGLDDAQTEYLESLLNVSPGTLTSTATTKSGGGGKKGYTHVNGGTSNTHNDGTLSTSSSSSSSSSIPLPLPPPSIDPALQASLVSQVRDLLPDYGEGFVAACLDEMDSDAEVVIAALLEGKYPPHLAAELGNDGSGGEQAGMDAYQKRREEKVKAFKSKGKERIDAVMPVVERGGGGGAMQPTISTVSKAPHPTPPPLPPFPQQQPRSVSSFNTALYLDTRDATLRSSLLAAADRAQLEENDGYEDEYDDSFDDLVQYGSTIDDGTGSGEVDGTCTNTKSGRRKIQQDRQQGSVMNQEMAKLSLASASAAAASSQQQNQQGGRKGGAMPYWVLDGKVYNYAKPGATEVKGGMVSAQQAVHEAEIAAQAIHGRGPSERFRNPSGGDNGGGKEDGGEEEEGGGTGVNDDGGGRGGGRGRGRERGGVGGGKDKEWLQHKRKDANKAAVGNHHRKDRALAKMNKAGL